MWFGGGTALAKRCFSTWWWKEENIIQTIFLFIGGCKQMWSFSFRWQPCSSCSNVQRLSSQAACRMVPKAQHRALCSEPLTFWVGWSSCLEKCLDLLLWTDFFQCSHRVLFCAAGTCEAESIDGNLASTNAFTIFGIACSLRLYKTTLI